MLNKEFRQFTSKEEVEQFKAIFRQEFSDEHFLMFLRKFRGSMIYRGKSSLSYKYFDKI
jgi:hypothetical protein